MNTGNNKIHIWQEFIYIQNLFGKMIETTLRICGSSPIIMTLKLIVDYWSLQHKILYCYTWSLHLLRNTYSLPRDKHHNWLQYASYTKVSQHLNSSYKLSSWQNKITSLFTVSVRISKGSFIIHIHIHPTINTGLFYL